MAVSKKTPKRRPLTRRQILRAAVRIADKDGIQLVSMRRIAETQGVEAMSLYNHVANKNDVLDGMVELVAEKIEFDISGGWKVGMRERSASIRNVLDQHPWAAILIVSRKNIGPVMLNYVDKTIGCLRAAGFTYELADKSINAIDSHLYGFVLQDQNFPFEPTEFSNAASDFLPMLSEEEYPHLRGMAQSIIQGDHDGVQDLDFGLELVLEGLERILENDLRG